MLAAIPEETVCCFLDSSKRAGSRADSDDVEVNVKHTFIELVVTPKRARRQRSLTDTELLFIGDVDGSSDFSDASTGIPSDEESAVVNDQHQLTEWRSPFWGPAEDHFYAMSGSDNALFPPLTEMTSEQGSLLSFPYDYQSQWGMMANDFSWLSQVPGTTNQGCPTQSTSGYDVRTRDAEVDSSPDVKTTVMIRNLPSQYTRSMMIELLEDEGFEGTYDLVYVPMDFSGNRCLGYSFVNFLTPSDASRCWQAFNGFSDWEASGEAACQVVWSDPHQGFDALVERYRNSPVMHESVPEEWKPACFTDGVRVAFPAPTVPIKAPKQKSNAKKKQR